MHPHRSHGRALLAFHRAHGLSAAAPHSEPRLFPDPPARGARRTGPPTTQPAVVPGRRPCPHRFGECDGENQHGDDYCPCDCAPCVAAVQRLRARQVGL